MRIHVLLLAGAFLAACATPSMLSRYRGLDGEQKAQFLAAYPELNPTQREAFLDYPGSYPNPIESSVSRGPSALVVTGAEGEITKGHSLRLVATLEYRRKPPVRVEVSGESRWSAHPGPVEMAGPELRYGCVSNDVVVTAEFLGELSGSQVARLRMPVSSLRMRVADRSRSLDRPEWVKLEVLATCEDGSRSDVSCLAAWATSAPGAETEGCGMIHLKAGSEAAVDIPVSATYGGKTVQGAIRLPEPSPEPR